jgi:hypothetical protein
MRSSSRQGLNKLLGPMQEKLHNASPLPNVQAPNGLLPEGVLPEGLLPEGLFPVLAAAASGRVDSRDSLVE